MNAAGSDRAYSESEIASRLAAELPHWRSEGGWIKRIYRTYGWKASMMVANAIGHLAEAAWHHPDLIVSYATVEVRLQTHTAKGVTEKDFALAHRIEEMICWRPGLEGAALEGTPQDERYGYLKYDE